jgi:hypothetical protein
VDLFEYAEHASEDQLWQLREDVRRRLREISLPEGQLCFLLIDSTLFAARVELAIDGDELPLKGPFADVHVEAAPQSWPTFRLGQDELPDGF